MSTPLSVLEQRRSSLLQQISELGDFRPGSITGTGGRCGTPSCHCHRDNDPGHAAHPRLTYKSDGKTVTESFPSPAAQRKAEAEIADVPPVPGIEPLLRGCKRADLPSPSGRGDAHAAGKKTAEAIQREVAQEVNRLLQVVFAGCRKTGQSDLEAVEMLVRESMHRAGAYGARGSCAARVSRPHPLCLWPHAHYHETRSHSY